MGARHGAAGGGSRGTSGGSGRKYPRTGWALLGLDAIELGIALQLLGALESDTVRLEEAVAAHRAALEECTRERSPLHWAKGQNYLGLALEALGTRESDTARLQEAVAAYRAALLEVTPEREPLQSAEAQAHLNRALKGLPTVRSISTGSAHCPPPSAGASSRA